MRRETKENTPFVLNLCLNKLRVLECSELSLCLAPCVHKMNNAQCACAFSSDVFLEDCARTLQSGHVRFFAWFQERVSRPTQQRDRVRLF